jgi:FkbM family methyltransferase
MKYARGVWLPNHEQHMVEWMKSVNVLVDGKLTYQWSKLSAAMKHVKQWRTAVDIGAHVGTWSMHLAERFDKVVAFEPIEEHRRCFCANVPTKSRAAIILHPCALGDHDDSVTFEIPPGSSGGTHINGHGDIPVRTLDTFELKQVDFLKIDVEGYELFAVRGGEKTIRGNRPVIVVEQKPKGLAERYGQTRMAAVELLQSWGAKIKFEMSGDYCLSWETR